MSESVTGEYTGSPRADSVRQHTPPLRSSLPSSTPASYKSSGSHTYASKVISRDDTKLHLAAEVRGLFVGPMPTLSFLDEFLPLSGDNVLDPSMEKAFEGVAKQKNEKDMYSIFTPTPMVTHNVIVLPPISQCIQQPLIPPNEKPTDISAMELYIEFKITVAQDPFVDPPEDLTGDKLKEFEFERNSEDSRSIRGQIASYSAALAGSQFRVHTFCVLIFGNLARLIRWDRSGAIVTRRFNYVDQPYLADFFYRYAHLTPRQRGHDTSVSLAPAEEILEMGPNNEQQLMDHNRHHGSFYKISVSDKCNRGQHDHQLIISYPLRYSARSPFGRATRPMHAYHMGSKKIVFLKDYWRAVGEGMEKEGDIYRDLEKHKVPNIAPFGGGDDVLDHETLTPGFRSKPWACWSKEMSSFHQYRLYLKIVARPLTQFHSSHEFVSAIADAMEAHQHAYFDAKILHRDISVGNVMIDDENKGVLIDWDLCKRVPDKEKQEGDQQPSNKTAGQHVNGTRRPDRTGTWQFMSARLLQDNKAPNTREDDLESCLHVLTWVALTYTAVETPQDQLDYLLESFDETYPVGANGVKGGKAKRSILKDGTIVDTVVFRDRQALSNLIVDLTDILAVRYQSEPTQEEEENVRSAKQLNLSDKMMNEFYAHKYHKRMDNLATPDWLVNTFKRHLADRSAWPINDDGPEPLGQNAESSRKRKREVEQLSLRAPLQKTSRFAHSSSNNS